MPAIQFIDPRTLMRMKNLQMRAKAVVEGFFAGIHRSPYHGFSVEFSEYREYSSGDDLRYLDWRLLARSDRHYVKRFEDETSLLAYLLVDISRSMAYGSTGYAKSDYGRTLAATLAYFLHLQRDAAGLVLFDETVRDYLPPRHRGDHLRRIMAALGREPEGIATNLAAPLEQIARTVRKRGLVVLISDLLAPHDALHAQLGYLRARGHDVAVLRVLDPAELEFSFRDPLTFHDMESGRRMYVDPGDARRQYLERFQAHQAELEQACRDLGVDFVVCPSDRPLELALFDLVRLRSQQSHLTARRNKQAAGAR